MVEKIQSVVSSVLNKFKNLIELAGIKPQTKSTKEVMKWALYQTRLKELCDEHVKYLQEMISGGVALEAVIVLEDYYGQNMIIEGNHRRWAYFLSGASYIEVVMIPKSIWSQFSDIELVEIGMAYNGLPKKRELYINKKDTKDFMYKYIQDGESIVHLPNKLLSFGYTPKETKTLMKYADRMHKHFELLGTLGKDFTYKNCYMRLYQISKLSNYFRNVRYYNSFSTRHIGPNKKEINDMLKTCNITNLDELINQVIPNKHSHNLNLFHQVLLFH